MNREREGELLKAIRGNSPQVVANILHEHYTELSRESLKGYTPSSELAYYWRKVAKAAKAIGEVKQ